MAGTFLDEDLADAYDDDELAVVGTVSGTEVPGFFDKEYVRALGMVSSTHPVFRFAATYSAAMAVAGTVAIEGTSYTIRDREPIDDGAELLALLEEV